MTSDNLESATYSPVSRIEEKKIVLSRDFDKFVIIIRYKHYKAFSLNCHFCNRGRGDIFSGVTSNLSAGAIFSTGIICVKIGGVIY